MCRTEVVFSSIRIPSPLIEIVCIQEKDDDFIFSAVLKLLFPNVSAVEKWEYRSIRRPGMMLAIIVRCMKAREARENMVSRSVCCVLVGKTPLSLKLSEKASTVKQRIRCVLDPCSLTQYGVP